LLASGGRIKALHLAEVNPPVRRGRNVVVHVQVPQLGLSGLLMRGEELPESTQSGDLFTAQAEAACDGGDVATAVLRLLRIVALGAELVHLGAVAAVVDRADQHANAVAAD